MRKIKKKERGITLIALIITVLIMLILAGVAISVLTTDGNLFLKAQSAVEKYNNAVKVQDEKIASLMNEFDSYFNRYSNGESTEIEKVNATYEGNGEVMRYVVLKSGTYAIELWGANGGSRYGALEEKKPGNGGYTYGEIYLEKGTELFFYVGTTPGRMEVSRTGQTSGWNAGGKAGNSSAASGFVIGAGGGGATDVRLTLGEWNDFDSLKSRIMVSAGGGGSTNYNDGGSAGGITGYSGSNANKGSQGRCTPGGGATNTSGGSGRVGGFGVAVDGVVNLNTSGVGGGGYYAGGTGTSGGTGYAGAGGGGGSSYISGHLGCDSITEDSTSTNIVHTGNENHYSGYIFTNTKMIDGEGYEWTNEKGSQTQMPNPAGGFFELGIGNNGNGYAKITYLGIE